MARPDGDSFAVSIVKLMFAVVPSPEENLHIQYAWRQRIGLVVAVSIPTMLGLIVAMLAAWGWFPGLTEGFVRKPDQELHVAVQELSTQISGLSATIQQVDKRANAREATRLRADLLDTMAKACHAKNQELHLEYTKSLDAMMAEYQRLNNGVPYEPLPCSAL